MKIAPLMAAFRKSSEPFECLLVHTGQHYDVSMSDVFFAQLGLPEPDIHLGVGAGSQATQTGRTMEALESVLEEQAPDLIVVVGDVNSTLAAAIVAAKAGLPLAHVEAGLRSFDRRMPEEVNRVVTDSLASYLFATEEDAVENLRREGVADDRIFMVGNVMIDTLMALLPQIKARAMAAELGLRPGAYGVVTLHRPSNVDDSARLESWVAALEEMAVQIPLVFPAHPRTRGRLIQAGLIDRLGAAGILLVDPLPYVEFVSLVADFEACAHGLRRHPGRNDRSRGPLPDVAGYHRASGDHRPRHEPPRGRRPSGRSGGGEEHPRSAAIQTRPASDVGRSSCRENCRTPENAGLAGLR